MGGVSFDVAVAGGGPSFEKHKTVQSSGAVAEFSFERSLKSTEKWQVVFFFF